jgi:hypothetical protein
MFYVRRGQKRSDADLYRGIRRNEQELAEFEQRRLKIMLYMMRAVEK